MSRRLRVLVVDDSQAYRQELASLLSSESYLRMVGMAKHGLEAMSLAEQHKPDVVLMDQNMPGLSGVEVTRRIKRSFPDMRVLFLAADTEARQAARRAGADGFFTKG